MSLSRHQAITRRSISGRSIFGGTAVNGEVSVIVRFLFLQFRSRTDGEPSTRGRSHWTPRYHPACARVTRAPLVHGCDGPSRPVLLRPRRPGPFFRRLPGDGRISAFDDEAYRTRPIAH